MKSTWFENACVTVCILAAIGATVFLTVWFSGPESLHHLCGDATSRVYPEFRAAKVAECIATARGR